MNTISSSKSSASLFDLPSEPRSLQLHGVPFQIPWSTPRQLWLFGAGVLVATFAFCSSAAHAVKTGREAAEKIGRDCAPSIVAAQHIRTALADLDANLANHLLSLPDSKESKLAVRAAEERRKELSDNLVTAAQNITFGEQERAPILTIVRSLQTYEATMARARALQERGDAAGALAQAREATHLMHNSMIAAADALDRANSTVLHVTYERQRSQARRAISVLVLCGGALIGALGFTQLFLLQKTHRVVNLGLLAATVAAAFTALHVTVQSARSAGQLKIAVEDAFASVHFLWQTRAVAYDANGEESRYLLDPANASAHQKRFLDNTVRIALAPSDPDFRRIADSGSWSGDFSGFLKQELENVTFKGEREAALQALRKFGAYLEIDAKIRAAEKAGRHQEAVGVCLSYEAGGSNLAFDDFDAALGRVLSINSEAFDETIRQAMEDLRGFGFSIPAAAVLIMLLSAAGLAPRLREYAA